MMLNAMLALLAMTFAFFTEELPQLLAPMCKNLLRTEEEDLENMEWSVYSPDLNPIDLV